MTIEKALQKAHSVKREGYSLKSVLDMGEFWAFYFEDPTLIDEDDVSYPGEPYITINKQTGTVGEFLPIQDLVLYGKAKPIQIPI